MVHTHHILLVNIKLELWKVRWISFWFPANSITQRGLYMDSNGIQTTGSSSIESNYPSFSLCGSETCTSLLPIWSIPPPIGIECERLDHFLAFISSNRAVIATYASKDFMRVLKLDLFFISQKRKLYTALLPKKKKKKVMLPLLQI